MKRQRLSREKQQIRDEGRVKKSGDTEMKAQNNQSIQNASQNISQTYNVRLICDPIIQAQKPRTNKKQTAKQ